MNDSTPELPRHVELGHLGDLVRDDPATVGAILRAAGVDEALIAEVVGARGVEAALQAIEAVALGPDTETSPAEVWAALGGGDEQIKRLWRSMGFVDLDDDDPSLRPLDMDALTQAITLREVGGITEDALYQQARTIGRSVSRIADAQIAAIAEGVREIEAELEGAPDTPPTPALLSAAIAAYLPVLENLLSYMYRRHLAAAAERTLVAMSDDADGRKTTSMAIGFADIVAFSVSSLQLNEYELAQLLDRFESTTADVVSQGGGRVVKMIGDEVMFVADDANSAAEIAVHLLESFDEGGPGGQLRSGVAFGPLLNRQGDYYGATVNLASRLEGIARPGTALIDEAMASALDPDRFFLKPVRGRELKGVGYHEPRVLRRTRR